MADAALEFDALVTNMGSSKAVARLVGGHDCVCHGALSDRTQKQLLYRRKLQFGTGDIVTPMVPSSNATKLAAKKAKLAQALRDVQGKTAMGSLQQLMMQHLRDTARHFCFYSLPLEVAKSLPIKQRSVALTSMLSVKSQPTTKLRSPF